MGWRRYSHRLERGGLLAQPLPPEDPSWVFRGCYWRWQVVKESRTLSNDDEVKYLEELRDFLQHQIRKIEERLDKLRSNPR